MEAAIAHFIDQIPLMVTIKHSEFALAFLLTILFLTCMCMILMSLAAFASIALDHKTHPAEMMCARAKAASYFLAFGVIVPLLGDAVPYVAGSVFILGVVWGIVKIVHGMVIAVRSCTARSQ